MKRRLYAVAIAFLSLVWAVAYAQDLESLLGHHPSQFGEQHDPYHHATAVDGTNCCHGGDCVEYRGEVQKVPGGWQAGPWFVPSERAIKPHTLAQRVRGIYSICFWNGRAGAISSGPKATIRCGHFPESGT
jgi:hypothetical protein